MHSEVRKLHVIEEVLKVEDEALLIEVQSLLENRNNNRKEAIKSKPSDYAGCISKQTARELLHQIEESRNEWERDI